MYTKHELNSTPSSTPNNEKRFYSKSPVETVSKNIFFQQRLEKAVQNNDYETTKFLLTLGVNPNIDLLERTDEKIYDNNLLIELLVAAGVHPFFKEKTSFRKDSNIIVQ